MIDREEMIRQNDECRKAYRDGIAAYIERLNSEGHQKREAFMPPASFFPHIEEYRQKYIRMLGLDRLESDSLPLPTLTLISEEEAVDIYRLTLAVTPEIPRFGLLFVPRGTKAAPLVIAQHGSGGTPELCADLHGPNKYAHMVRRALDRGAVVFAPQLLLWNHAAEKPHQRTHPLPFDRNHTDKDLKRFGSSITALEIRGIMNAITYLASLSFVDADKIGMVGHSYGGYFTLCTMAADTRIKAGFSGGVFNDRNRHCGFDWGYKDAANTFQDAEIAALCAPRKLFVTVGEKDELFNVSSAKEEAARAKRYFEGAGCPQNFAFSTWEGEHAFPDSDEGFAFLFSALS